RRSFLLQQKMRSKPTWAVISFCWFGLHLALLLSCGAVVNTALPVFAGPDLWVGVFGNGDGGFS
ncbi:MAG: hypothetical protein ACOZCO_14415, partial [Bacteroidota bacterium]